MPETLVNDINIYVFIKSQQSEGEKSREKLLPTCVPIAARWRLVRFRVCSKPDRATSPTHAR
jgi:hypothetical protein